MSLEFLFASLVIIASPGAGVLLTISIGVSGGVRASLLAALGCTLGIIPHMLIALSGVAAVFYSSELAFQGLKMCGVMYLLYMGWSVFREKTRMALLPPERAASAVKIIVSAILLNLLNPKLSLFFLTFLPQFIPAQAKAPVRMMLELSLVFMLLSTLVFAVYGMLAGLAHRHFQGRVLVPAWLRYGVALMFVLLAVQLVFLSL